MKLNLTYVMDPLCGWCYGFSPVMKKISERYGSEIDIELLSGGMAIGEGVMPVEAIRDYIKSASAIVAEKTGVKFGRAFYENILDKNGLILSSEPPSIALAVFREMSDQVLNFSTKLQEALFIHGKRLDENQTYADIVESLNIDQNEFLARLLQPEYKKRAYAEFERCRSLGVTGYPTLIAQANNKSTVLSRGYQGFESLKPAIEQLLN